VPVVEEFRRQSSPVSEFVDEWCEIGPHKLPSMMLYDAYAKWCKDQGVAVGTSAKFSQRLLQLYPGLAAVRMMFNQTQVRGFEGITLTTAAVDRFLGGRR
jgi:phage/plasmid-associated DNA primase